MWRHTNQYLQVPTKFDPVIEVKLEYISKLKILFACYTNETELFICMMLFLQDMPDYNKLVLSCSHTKAFVFYINRRNLSVQRSIILKTF